MLIRFDAEDDDNAFSSVLSKSPDALTVRCTVELPDKYEKGERTAALKYIGGNEKTKGITVKSSHKGACCASDAGEDEGSFLQIWLRY
jgi:hypothetical protein